MLSYTADIGKIFLLTERVEVEEIACPKKSNKMYLLCVRTCTPKYGHLEYFNNVGRGTHALSKKLQCFSCYSLVVNHSEIFWRHDKNAGKVK